MTFLTSEAFIVAYSIGIVLVTAAIICIFIVERMGK